MDDLRAARPQVRYGDVVCAVCNCACDFAEYGEHQGNMRNDGRGLLTGEGWVNIMIWCHGAEEMIRVSFETLRNMGYGYKAYPRKIIAFQSAPAPELPSSHETKSLLLHEQPTSQPLSLSYIEAEVQIQATVERDEVDPKREAPGDLHP